jgi:hypothetical protein
MTGNAPAVAPPTVPQEGPAARGPGAWLSGVARRERARLRQPRRLVALAILVVVFGLTLVGLIARGEAAGADALAYWAGTRAWLSGADPYAPTGPYLPYVYPAWMLPLFVPWALLPWEIAWFLWRSLVIVGLLWTILWLYRRRPFATAIAVAVLAFPWAANLDTGNAGAVLALALWGALFVGPRLGGLIWAAATWMKWAPLVVWLFLAPRARGWGLVWLAVGGVVSLVFLSATIAQLETLFGFGPRPLRLDYLVLAWPVLAWLWLRPALFMQLGPRHWREDASLAGRWLGSWVRRFRDDPAAAAGDVAGHARGFIGLSR